LGSWHLQETRRDAFLPKADLSGSPQIRLPKDWGS
jgi:hypothetical protein